MTFKKVDAHTFEVSPEGGREFMNSFVNWEPSAGIYFAVSNRALKIRPNGEMVLMTVEEVASSACGRRGQPMALGADRGPTSCS